MTLQSFGYRLTKPDDGDSNEDYALAAYVANSPQVPASHMYPMSHWPLADARVPLSIVTGWSRLFQLTRYVLAGQAENDIYPIWITSAE